MSEIPELEVITSSCREDYTTLEEIIKERRMLKTGIKLLHIAMFDNDLKSLHSKELDLPTFSLTDFKLTPYYSLYVPLYSSITDLEDINKTKLQSYLIYLSYLYNIDFLNLYENNPSMFTSLISSLNITPELKENLFSLLAKNEAPYFSTNIYKLNNAEFRSNLQQDDMRLRRELM